MIYTIKTSNGTPIAICNRNIGVYHAVHQRIVESLGMSHDYSSREYEELL